MPLDDYASVGGGGALRLKGAKVSKSKKKKKKDKAGLERALSDAGGELALVKKDGDDGDDEVEKRIMKSRKGDAEEEEDVSVTRKTEAERRLDEARRKRFLEMAENPDARPELLKTHKERVEELNSFLSKLSEHNDMPKIGPG
ncbi:hypothetical protein jhhlp_008698 [Lomentospora prolificans]|uniref:DUF1754-domain-containing protein n=1 Tax=Lomentospora prolificans TaxID=41688 RepID=A0A2N3MYR7_9PEZI|nr:hypothetical protein jhhlp_008698 [Lomentospora prolificans]